MGEEPLPRRKSRRMAELSIPQRMGNIKKFGIGHELTAGIFTIGFGRLDPPTLFGCIFLVGSGRVDLLCLEHRHRNHGGGTPLY